MAYPTPQRYLTACELHKPSVEDNLTFLMVDECIRKPQMRNTTAYGLP